MQCQDHSKRNVHIRCPKKYIAENPMDKVQIYVKYRQVVKKTGKTETYNTEELEELNQYLDKMYAETEDTVFLAVKINFCLVCV